MKRIIELLACGVTDDAGVVLQNGTVTFYEAGTTTLVTAYEDFGLTEPHSNPATLDAAGRLVAFYDGRVKMVIQDSDGAVVRTIDNVGTEDSDLVFSSQTVIPAGAIMDYGGSSAPAGWLLCDGSAVSRSLYASLFTAIGTSFGVGDGSTTFNVPDSRGRARIGVGTGSGLTARSLADLVGAETHTLSSTDVPAHTHGVGTYATASSGSHSHNIGVNTGGAGIDHLASGSFSNGGGPVYTGVGAADTDAQGSHTHTLSGSSASYGSGGAHNNMQPSLAVTAIIKT